MNSRWGTGVPQGTGSFPVSRLSSRVLSVIPLPISFPIPNSQFLISVSILLLLAGPSIALAQTGNTFAIGISGGPVGAVDDHVDGHARLGPLIRLGTADEGWQWKVGFNWYGADVEEEVDGSFQQFGRLRIRPIMGGYGYTRSFGRVSGTAALLAGFALTSFHLDPAFADAYRNSLQAGSIDDSTNLPFVVKPELSVWVDLNRRFGLNVSTGYMFAQPVVTLQSPAGNDKREVNANAFMLSAGIVYSVF
ncbi:MAG: hypothetical protein AB7F99_18325 [Vicinamibacterales bacterium]